ncbi:Bifunctional inhibitor/lipid-transfer protein/seed storage 2S albumin superfamily protein [Striga hermonthica]|uniref:Bifunctional inhibitor/lipid-transfer protein/seed storage 2S albumin superfamily protein n=1 Tax=Striga hermonthica TaxID=68872 RepID=A0A9N7NB24_STRHE|nr:Bifunctional inhibitor/lipid-transfer protein/seed storage 2S albumin superfamily protein [Striga hermonthica]
MSISSKTGLALFFSCVVAITATTAVMAQCEGNFQGLMQQCSRYVQKTGPRESPSQECCNVVKSVDLPCVCRHITGQVEQIVSMEKAAYVAAFCGKPLPRGTKCGSYVVPGN